LEKTPETHGLWPDARVRPREPANAYAHLKAFLKTLAVGRGSTRKTRLQSNFPGSARLGLRVNAITIGVHEISCLADEKPLEAWIEACTISGLKGIPAYSERFDWACATSRTGRQMLF
jgi:hypothetical protein